MPEAQVQQERVESEESKAVVLGKQLQQLRKSRGYSIEDVAGQLYLDSSMITALEAGDYSKVPSPAYIKGYIRNYIKIFNAMSEFETFNLYDSNTESIKNIKVSNSLEKFNVPVKKIAYKKILALFILISIVFVLYQLEVQFGIFKKIDFASVSKVEVAETAVENEKILNSDTVVDVASSKNPVTINSDNIIKLSESKSTEHLTYNHLDSIRLQFSHDSWTQIKDAAGKKLISRLVKTGEELNFSGKLPFTVTLGDSRAVKIQVNGNDFKQSNYNKKQISHFVIN